MKAKWRTLASAPTREDLTKLINEYYCSENYIITDDLDVGGRYYVRNTKRNNTLDTRVWRKRGRWYFGVEDEG